MDNSKSNGWQIPELRIFHSSRGTIVHAKGWPAIITVGGVAAIAILLILL